MGSICQAPRILQIIPNLKPGTAARGAIDMITALATPDNKPVILSKGGPLRPDLLRTGGDLIPAETEREGLVSLYRLARRISALNKTHSFDLLHSHSPATAWAAHLSKSALPRVVTLHDRFHPKGRLESWFAEAIRSADHIIAVSEHVAEHARTVLSVSSDRLSVIPPGVNLARFSYGAVHVDRVVRLAQKWLLPDGVPLILLPGPLRKTKGHRILIEALEQIDRPYVAIFVGDDQKTDRTTRKYIQKLETLILSRKLGSKIRFGGACDDMPAAYRLADLIVNPTILPDPSDTTALEAQAMGRPVVASDLGATSEIVTPNETGWLVPPGDVPSLAAAITYVLALKVSEREQLAQVATANIAANFTREQFCDQTMSIYQQVLARHAQRIDPRQETVDMQGSEDKITA